MSLDLNDAATDGRWVAVPLLALCLFLAGTAFAEQRDAFRVCADPNNLPFSNQAQQGFENRLAELLAKDLGLPVEYTWFPQRMGFIRNTLRAKDPDHDRYKCDVVIGVPAGYELAITTKPYYRSTYALVYVKGRGLDDIQTGADVINLDPARKQALRVGVFERTPAAQWLAKHGDFDATKSYITMSGDPAAYPGELVEKELGAGKIDAAILWGPIAGYFATQAKDVEMRVIPLRSEPGIRFDFAISAAVRFGDGEWKQEIQGALDRKADAIKALLREYHVPLVAEDGSLLADTSAPQP
jgi:quinoprotein dehydrogenase-associated probable ABC transporter substrate-binding protein